MAEKITIIGGAGFVGTNLCKQFELSGQIFEIIDIKMSQQFPEKCKIADVRDLQNLRKAVTGSVVINLAAVHRDDVRDRSEYERTNVLGAENIVTVCVEKRIHRIIFTSTVAVYGFADKATDENGAINPFNEYGRTKFLAEKIFRDWQTKNNGSLIIVRPTAIFGEGNRGNIFNLLEQIASGKFLMVGDGKNKKSIAYIGNVVSFLQTCVSSDIRFGIFNYVDTPDLTMNELVSKVRFRLKGKAGVGFRLPYFLGILIGYLADIVSTITGKSLPVSSIRVKKFTSSTEFVSSKLELEGFSPPFQISEGIERTLQSEFIEPDPLREIFYTE